MFSFEQLLVYQESIAFVQVIYRYCLLFPPEEKFSLSNQLRRASTSISLNIAEGSSRTEKDFSHFITLARGSCYECVAILTIAKKQKYIEESQYVEAYNKLIILVKMLNALRKSLNMPKP